MEDPRYHVVITATARDMLREVGRKYGAKTYEVLRDLILSLEVDPEHKGQPLRHPLHGFHSLHYSRFRVIYRVERGRAEVLVIAAGHHASGDRNDIYQVIKRLVDGGMLDIRRREDDPDPG